MSVVLRLQRGVGDSGVPVIWSWGPSCCEGSLISTQLLSCWTGLLRDPLGSGSLILLALPPSVLRSAVIRACLRSPVKGVVPCGGTQGRRCASDPKGRSYAMWCRAGRLPTGEEPQRSFGQSRGETQACVIYGKGSIALWSQCLGSDPRCALC